MRSRKLISLLGPAVLAILLFTACSDDDDPTKPLPPSSAEATIGADGGTLEILDKLALEIPQGALTGDVDFSAEVNTALPIPPGGYTRVSAVFTIEPSGTVFDSDATLTLQYSESLLGGADESDIVIFRHDGSVWDELDGDVDQENNTVTGVTGHLSDYVAVVETFIPPTDVYAELEVHREFITGDKADVVYQVADRIEARFESGGDMPTFLRAEQVDFGEWTLGWYDGENLHRYYNPMVSEFLTAGQTYDFVITGDENVPPLTQSVPVFDVEPVLSNVEWGQAFPMTGFEVTWDGTTPSGNIKLVLEGPGDTTLNLDVPNTGSYTFTESQLDAVGTGVGTIGLLLESGAPITATGFDHESYISMSTSHVVGVTFSRATVIAEFNGSSTPNAAIPDGPSGGGSGAAVTDVINVPVSGAVDSVRVYIDANHNYSSDLIIRVRSPEGTEARVMFIGEGGEPNVGGPQGWYPSDYTPKDDLNIFDGDQVNGNWTIDARDYSYQQAGTLVEWRLQIFYAE